MSTEAPFFDIGGGNGGVAEALGQDGLVTCLVEPGETAIANARRRGLANLVCASFYAAGFRTGSLPAVGLFDVLEHIADHRAFLQSVRSAMRPKARIFVTVPAYQWLWSPFDATAGHHRRYSRGSLEAVLTSTGFDILQSTYLFAPLVLPVFAVRTLPGWVGRATGVSPQSKRTHHGVRTRSALARTTVAAVRTLLDAEFEQLRRGRSIPWGATCFVVAQAS